MKKEKIIWVIQAIISIVIIIIGIKITIYHFENDELTNMQLFKKFYISYIVIFLGGIIVKVLDFINKNK